MKKIAAVVFLCLMTTQSFGFSLFPKCRACSKGLALKSYEEIMESRGDLGIVPKFKDCLSACHWKSLDGMFYTYLANSLYYAGREWLEREADLSKAMKILGNREAPKGQDNPRDLNLKGETPSLLNILKALDNNKEIGSKKTPHLKKAIHIYNAINPRKGIDAGQTNQLIKHMKTVGGPQDISESEALSILKWMKALSESERFNTDNEETLKASIKKFVALYISAVNLNDFTEKMAWQLLQEIPAKGRNLNERARESTFLGGEFLPSATPEGFIEIVKKYAPSNRYIRHPEDKYHKAGERLAEIMEKIFTQVLAVWEAKTDTRFGDKIKLEPNEILKDFKRQTQEEKALGTPPEVKRSLKSILIPKKSCKRTCRTEDQGIKAGENFTKEVIENGKDASKTKLNWCLTHCPFNEYVSFFCGAFDNVGRDGFRDHNYTALDKLDPSKARLYATQNDGAHIEQCLNRFKKYGGAHDKGKIFIYNVSYLVRKAKEFNTATVQKVDDFKADPLDVPENLNDLESLPLETPDEGQTDYVEDLLKQYEDAEWLKDENLEAIPFPEGDDLGL